MRLEEIIRGMAITDRRGRFDVEINGVTADSRKVTPGDLFVAIRGLTRDGHAYIKQAVSSGAACVVAESWPEDVPESARPSVILVPSSRRALALLAANFHGQPSRKLLVAGVTGTNGKTTVTYLLESIVKAASKSVGVIGTVDCRFDGRSVDLGNTTPDAVLLQQSLAAMLAAGVTHVIMEVSSHALDQQRVTGVHFKVAGFTNLTQDHLDYHKSLDTYFEAKARLFSEALRKSRARGRMAVVNVDDPRGAALIERWGGKSLSVSLDPASSADVVALQAEYSLTGTKAVVRTSKGVWDIETALIGPHNLSNALVAIGMALAMGFSRQRIVRGLSALERVPGRLERVPGDPAKAVFVDYAHTPDALARIIAAMRPLTRGRIIVVFGSGGDRDKTKRKPMGEAVAAGADLAVVTNDNPRSEEPAEIARAVGEGLEAGGFMRMVGAPAPRTYKVELDRRAAIRAAIDWARADDVVIIAGKGHETYQLIGKQRFRFDDRDEARRILAGMPPPPPLTFDDRTSEIDTAQVVETFEISDGAMILAESSLPGQATENIDAEGILDVIELEEKAKAQAHAAAVAPVPPSLPVASSASVPPSLPVSSSASVPPSLPVASSASVPPSLPVSSSASVPPSLPVSSSAPPSLPVASSAPVAPSLPVSSSAEPGAAAVPPAVPADAAPGATAGNPPEKAKT